MKQSHQMNRRQFIGQAGCAALGTTGLLSTILNLGMASRVQAYTTTAPSDYKAMICLFLLGGNDSWNMLVPRTSSELLQYNALRNDLAIVPTPINDPSNISGRMFGVHPSLTNLASLYNNGKLSFVSNVGSLVAPLANAAAYTADVTKRPLNLFSHADQQQQWQTCVPDNVSPVGWAGLVSDIFSTKMPTISPFTYNISVSGLNLWQTGNTIIPYTIGFNPSGLSGVVALNDGAGSTLGDVSGSVNSLMGQLCRNIFDKTYLQATSDAQSAYSYYASYLGTDYFTGWGPTGENPLESQLKQIANMIMAFGSPGGAGAAANIKRQIFFVSMGGFDTHHNLMADQPDLFGQLNDAIGNFWTNLGAQAGMEAKTVMFSASDFGRTLCSNGSGADHAWGGNHFVIGGGLQGGKILGNTDSVFSQYPVFDGNLMANLDVTGASKLGRLLPGLAVEEYMYPILNWYGLTPSDIYNYVFANYKAAGHFGSSIRSSARIGLFSGTTY